METKHDFKMAVTKEGLKFLNWMDKKPQALSLTADERDCYKILSDIRENGVPSTGSPRQMAWLMAQDHIRIAEGRES